MVRLTQKKEKMKKAVLSIILVAMAIGAMAQDADKTNAKGDTNKKEIYVEENLVKPQFPGGDQALMEFFAKNLDYPDLAEAYGVEGRVIMSFLVDKDGSLNSISAKDCRIERFITTKFSQETEARQKELKEQFAKLFAKEGARIVRMMPNWQPGTLNGEPVKVRFNIPIKFSIPNK